MGTFEITVRVANPASPTLFEAVSLLVDTGATLSWIPREVLARLGVPPVSQFTFQLADGREIKRDVAGVLMAIDGRSLPVPVAFSETGEGAVLGATALEALGFAVDPVEKKLVPRNLLAMEASPAAVGHAVHGGCAAEVQSFSSEIATRNLQNVQRVFDMKFLGDEARGCRQWGDRRPRWFAFYASEFTPLSLRSERLSRLERVLCWLHGRNGIGGHRKGLERRLKDPGFQGMEAFFEVEVLAAAEQLSDSFDPFKMVPYPRVPGTESVPEFSAFLNQRQVYFEATCVRLRQQGNLPRTGAVLIGLGTTEKQLLDKLTGKKKQFCGDAPNVLLIGHESGFPGDHDGLVYMMHDALESVRVVSAAAIFSVSSLAPTKFLDLVANKAAKCPLTSGELKALRDICGAVERQV